MGKSILLRFKKDTGVVAYPYTEERKTHLLGFCPFFGLYQGPTYHGHMIEILLESGNWCRTELPDYYILQELTGVHTSEGLVYYLFQHEDEFLQLSHLKNIRSQEVISRMFLKYAEKQVRNHINSKLMNELFERLTDEKTLRTYLAQYCRPRNDSDSEYMISAIQRVDDQRLFRRIACDKWLSSNRRHVAIALAALERISEAYVNEEVVYRAALQKVRIAAVKRVHEDDQNVLKRIAKTHEDVPVRIAAVKRISDQKLCKQLASRAWDPESPQHVQLALAALKRVTDTDCLIAVARKAAFPKIRIAAVKRLDRRKQDLLCRIATSDKDEQVRLAAVRRIDRVTKLDWVAEHDMKPIVRTEATQRVKRLRGR